MRGENTVLVDCVRDGKIIKTYVFRYAATLGRSAPPTDAVFRTQAMEALSTDGLAAPPFHGIVFNISR